MTADVYVLASPTPILYVYPSQVHPHPAPSTGGGGMHYPTRLRPWERDDWPPEPEETRDREAEDLEALLILGAL